MATTSTSSLSDPPLPPNGPPTTLLSEAPAFWAIKSYARLSPRRRVLTEAELPRHVVYELGAHKTGVTCGNGIGETHRYDDHDHDHDGSHHHHHHDYHDHHDDHDGFRRSLLTHSATDFQDRAFTLADTKWVEVYVINDQVGGFGLWRGCMLAFGQR